MQSDTNSNYLNMVGQALVAYGLEDAQCDFLQHSDTITFRVESKDGGRYALRIHIPVNAGMGDHGNDPDMLRSELLWIEALRKGTDLVLQRPIRNQNKEMVTTIEHDGRTTHCTLLEWLDGEKFTKELENEDTAAQIGIMTGKLHLHASRWRTPKGFSRPQRDAEYFSAMLQQLALAVDDGRIAYADHKHLETSIEKLNRLLSRFRKTHQTFGLVHGDLHRGNMLIQHGELRVIDFSYCAQAPYLLDVGICMSNMRPDLHPIFIINYGRFMRLPLNHAQLIEGLYVGAMIGTFAIKLDDPEAQEALVNRIPLIAREYAARFNRDERFWFPR